MNSVNPLAIYGDGVLEKSNLSREEQVDLDDYSFSREYEYDVTGIDRMNNISGFQWNDVNNHIRIQQWVSGKWSIYLCLNGKKVKGMGTRSYDHKLIQEKYNMLYMLYFA